MKNYLTLLIFNIGLGVNCSSQTPEDTILLQSRNYNSIFKIKLTSSYTGKDTLQNGMIFHQIKKENSIGEIQFDFVGYKDSIVYSLMMNDVFASFPLYMTTKNQVFTLHGDHGLVDYIVKSDTAYVTALGEVKSNLIEIISINKIIASFYISPGYGIVAVKYNNKLSWWDADFFR